MFIVKMVGEWDVICVSLVVNVLGRRLGLGDVFGNVECGCDFCVVVCLVFCGGGEIVI